MTERRPIQPNDLANIVHINEPQISPDGRWVAFVRRGVDLFKNGYVDNIWLAPIEGGKPIQLTRSGKDKTPRWSPDGTQLAFVSSRGEKSQIYLLPVTTPGGEARQLTQTRTGSSAPAWSPDGTRIAYLTPLNATERTDLHDEAKPIDQLDERHRKERRKRDEAQFFDPMQVRRIPYRTASKYLDERCQQIQIIEVNKQDAKPILLTDLDTNHDAPHWLNNQTIITARSTTPEADEPYRNKAIFRIDIQSSEVLQLTGEGYSHHAPLPSPDGTQIALWRYINSQYFQQSMLALMNADGSHIQDLNAGIDRAVMLYQWQPNSDRLIGALASEGYTLLHDTLAFDQLQGGTGEVTGFDVSASGGIAFALSDASNPSALYWMAHSNGDPIQLTHYNKPLLDAVTVQATEEIWFKGADGQLIQGWYQRPVGYTKGERYPMVVLVHGGPHAMWGPGTRTMWHQWQALSAAGYVVFFSNPHGSDGYGGDFRASLRRLWGKLNHIDIMAGVDAMLALGFVDETRIGITGGSYGGYMAAWSISQTDRFAAAVAQRGVFNLLSKYGTTDIPAFTEDEFDGTPWEIHELLWELSPVAHANKIKTPLLILHAENDFRVPIEQAEQLFTYVRRSGGTVELVRYPRGGHELSRSGEPKHRIDRVERIIGWFNQYLA